MVRETEEKFEDEEVYGIEASELGSNSLHIDYCEVAWHRPPYAACLKKIADRKNGRLDVRFAGCSAAIGKKTCPAMKLRAEEVAAGHAIHYVNRDKLRAFNQYQAEMGGAAFAAAVDGDNVRKSKRAPKRDANAKTPELPQEDGYAAAINAAMSAKVEKPQAANDEVVQSVPKQAGSGMSMLEMARLKLNTKG